ncbi:sulfite exporter TauE/SafE family protein [Enterococcus dongliensis]|uniref:sulfite exporter TauE/SafE family protein n=1 Tax=Enterococcus dongliensis TaxID=2559925 RepID=UPI00288E902C|nr:sulfite exporter TauE/SafE family protein [Enterococcus dongliensis]MDT2604474.1 sulfite exporter TauE/SafE family protein [Enterococcus dongliensis]MDT2640574.1 sulfite exporter TauE/SafE family protein [Enterococcus dongliensis]MDT2645463.1 sulfite exporter TauE/SafE family protein [Enterococcus dongliensis]MDT2671889.1 sulfite exporter TauE/SafE family protein [Enterococcus dongliensis]MDT2711889.1 sulfite exporter TauE/SafE family protein [Enterococcus dongliensis]
MLISQIGLLLVTGGFAGILGSILGIGGGIILTPFLTLVMGLEIKYAIAASIVCVIATSSGATIAYLKDDMLNLRVAMFLEIATTIGAIVGAILSGIVPTGFLFLLFGGFLLFSVINMIQKLRGKSEALSNEVIGDPLAKKLKLNGSYYDKVLEKQIDYQVEKVPGGFAMMFGAGIASGLLGIGSGVFKVTAMDTIMKMPLKPSSATSNLMMGVTAAASAMVYFFNGTILPEIAAPLALGVLIGATIGSRIMQRLSSFVIRLIFVPILLFMGIQMILRGFGVII